MLAGLSRMEIAQTLDAQVEQLLAEYGCTEPPVDALAIAAGLGLELLWDDSQAGRGRIVQFGPDDELGTAPRESIFLRHDPRPERVQWAAAHEIGEARAEILFRELSIDPRDGDTRDGAVREQLANEWASRLLIPTAWFRAAAREHDWELPALKQTFSTASHELLARRMLDFESPVVVSLFDLGRLSWRRGNLPYRVPPLTAAERQLWRQVHESGEGAVLRDGGTIRGWAIHEPHWQREILRYELEEFE